MKIDKDQLYKTEEVADILKVSVITIKRYIAQNRIPLIKFNGIRRITGKVLLELLNKTEENGNK